MRFKQIIFFGILIVSLFIINSLVHSILTLNQKSDLVVSAKQELEKEKKTNENLKKRLSAIENPEFVEGEARNKLFLAKPGEEVIVLTNEQLAATKSGGVQALAKSPNWQLWWQLFF